MNPNTRPRRHRRTIVRDPRYGFTAISIDEYVERHAEANPDTDKAELAACLRDALAAKEAGELCDCGEPIWALGSALVGYMCFTCITGESTPSSDFEVVEKR